MLRFPHFGQRRKGSTVAPQLRHAGFGLTTAGTP